MQITFAKPLMKFSFDDGRKTLQNIYPVDDFLKNIGPDDWQGVWDGKKWNGWALGKRIINNDEMQWTHMDLLPRTLAYELGET